MIFEAFNVAQRKAFGPQYKQIRPFPLTRFAYASLMVQLALANWDVLRDIPRLPEYGITKSKVIKRAKAGTTRASVRMEFVKFENMVESAATRKSGELLCAILLPLTSILHFLEGDTIAPSFILPLYASYYYFAQQLEGDDEVELDEGTVDAVAAVIKQRWLGVGTKVGLRQDFHCMAFVLDPYVRAVVETALGDKELKRMDKPFTEAALHRVMLNAAGREENAKFAQLLCEYSRFKAKEGDYKILLSASALLVSERLNRDVLQNLPNEEKNVPVFRLLRCFQYMVRNNLGGKTMWQGLRESSGTSDGTGFASFVVNVLSVVPHAAGVERINKNHNMVHTKARASLTEDRTRKLLYCFTNLNLERRTTVVTFESFVQAVQEPEDAENFLASYELAWEEDQEALETLPACAHGDSGDEEEDGDTEGEEEQSNADFEFAVPDGFVAVPKPDDLLITRTDLMQLYVYMLWDGTGWELGKVKCYNPKRVRHNYDILWDEGVRGWKASLVDYFVQADITEENPQRAGHWIYMRLSA